MTVANNITAFRLNGQAAAVSPAIGERLSESLRERLGARDVKVGCDAGDCGACSVLVDGELVCACLTATQQVSGCSIETLAGLVGTDQHAIALAETFQAHGAAQCGICTPGMMVSAVSLLRNCQGSPDSFAIQESLGGVLCRCTGYRKIIDAVKAAAESSNSASLLLGEGGAGEPVCRIDGPGKVSGEEKFGDDVGPADSLSMRIIRSPFPRARFEIGDLDEFLADNDGIEFALTAADVTGNNRYGVMPGFADQPVFAVGETRFRGEAVAAVAGCWDAMRGFDDDLFPVEWNAIDHVQTMDEALRPEAPRLHGDRRGNIMCGGFVVCGNVDKALHEADAVAEGSFQTSFVEHAYIEPEAGFAYLEDGRVVVHACTQAPYMDRETVAEIIGLDPEKVRIVPTGCGGGFGSKLDLSVQPFLALATLKSGKPVRLAYSRQDSMQSTTKRHPGKLHVKVGATRDGRLAGLEFKGDYNTGAYASWGPTVVNRVPVHASGPYSVRHYRAEARGIHTHCPPSGAFRGFGVPQAAIAQESLLDELAEQLGIDALEFRIRNALANGVPTVCGQVFSQGVGIRACLEALRPYWRKSRQEDSGYNRSAEENGTVRWGTGVAAGWYGCGNTSLANPSSIKAGLWPGGTVALHQGAVDIGQGSNTVIAQIFAEALGVNLRSIKQVGADTDITPDAGKTSASRQTFVSGNAAFAAGSELRRKILKLCNASADAKLELGSPVVRISDGASDHHVDLERLECDREGYVLAATGTYDPPTKPLDEFGQGEPYAQFGYAAQLATVAVDTALGTVKVKKVVAAHDVGKAINPVLVEGQIHGGVAQGIGMALMEEFVPGRTENLHDYLIPTIGDVPPIKCLIIEEPDIHGPFGAKGLGEHALIPTAPAILNAIYNACGVRLRRVPATPDRVLAAIRETENG